MRKKTYPKKWLAIFIFQVQFKATVMKRFIATLVMFFMFTPVSIAYDFSTNPGDGSDTNPYFITTAEQLTSIGDDASLLDKCFMLMNDIDLAGAGDNADGSFSVAVIAPRTISGTITYFTGKFYGNGHTISNMTITPPYQNQYYLGLFGLILGDDDVPRVRDLHIDNFTINSFLSNYIAGLAGAIQNATVVNCFATGNIYTSIYASTQIGGLVGQLTGVMKNCGADVTITCQSYGTDNLTGGLVGYIYGGQVINCISASRLVAVSPYYFNGNQGVLSGYAPAEGGEVIDCATLADATYSPMPGTTEGVTVMSAAEMTEQANFEAINFNFNGTWQMGISYPVLHDMDIVVLESPIIISEGEQKSFGVYLANEPSGPITVSVSVSGDANVTVVAGSESITFTPANYYIPQSVVLEAQEDADYIENYATVTLSTTNESKTINIIKIESVHNWAQDNPGQGTPEDPYQIWTVKQLRSIGSDATVLNKNFKLVTDIDLAGVPFDTAVIAPDTDSETEYFQGIYFTGSFDGNRHVIKNLTITSAEKRDYVGLIGGFGSTANYITEVKDLGLENININLPLGSKYAGSVAPYMFYGLMRRCYATGNITVASGSPTEHIQWINYPYSYSVTYTYENVTQYVGGLTGFATGTSVAYPEYTGYVGLIEDCYADVDITCTGPGQAQHVGGVAGWEQGLPYPAHFRNCYALGTLSSANMQAASGFLGYAGTNNSGVTFENCFWNTETTTQTVGVMPNSTTISIPYPPYFQTQPITYNGISGISSAQMADQTVFAGWDFVDETANGENDYWKMSPTKPVLGFESILDIDKAAVTIDENGQTTLGVKMKYDPLVTTIVNISVVDDNDITTDIVTLSFDSDNYDDIQTVTVSAADDADFTSDTAYVQFEVDGQITSVFVIESDDDNNPDYNKDAWVNMLDFAVMASAWHTTDANNNLAGDVYVDIEDLALFAQAWEPVRLLYDDFETGDLTAFDWLLTQNSGSGWSTTDTITDSTPYEGTYCAQAYGGNFDVCTMRIEDVDVTFFNTIRFAYKTSTEGRFDMLRFYVQKQGEAEVEIAQWAGEVDWGVYEYEFEPGIYTFKWAFTKDYDESHGQDMVWVDKIEFLRLYK